MSLGISKDLTVNPGAFPKIILCHAARLTSLQAIVLLKRVVIAHDFLHFSNFAEDAIHDKVEVWERLLQPEDPGVLDGTDRDFVTRVEAFEVGLTSMDYELFDAANLTNNPEEVLYVVPIVEVLHSDAALDADGDAHLFPHLNDNLGDEVRIIHQKSTDLAIVEPG